MIYFDEEGSELVKFLVKILLDNTHSSNPELYKEGNTKVNYKVYS